MKRIDIICLAILSTGLFAFIAILIALPQPNHRFVFRSIDAAVMGIGLVWGCISTWARVYVCDAEAFVVGGYSQGHAQTVELRATICIEFLGRVHCDSHRHGRDINFDLGVRKLKSRRGRRS